MKSDVVSTVLVGTAKPSSMQRNVDLLNAAIPDAAWAEFDALAAPALIGQTSFG